VTSPEPSLATALRRLFNIENRRAAIRPGRIHHIADFSRPITVYVPAGYDERDDRRYPVLYMQDGQNLFDGERAYIPGQHWRLQEAADAAVGERGAAAAIIVGVDHAGAARIDEYTPSRDPRHKGGGHADEYGRLLLEELKPLIDERFRTLPGQTGIGGSSLGGLVSLHLALKNPQAFTRAAVMSPSVWWNNRSILEEVDAFDGPRPRIWLDIGGREGREALHDARMLRDELLAKSWNDATLRYFEDRRADHSERAWRARVRKALEFLFPPQ